MALALIMAGSLWQPGEASGTYLTGAKTLVANILAFDVDSSTNMIKPGDAWSSCGGSATLPYNPSYFSPAAMRLFELLSGSNRSVVLLPLLLL